MYSYATRIVLSTTTFVAHLVKGKSEIASELGLLGSFKCTCFLSLFLSMVRPLSAAVLLQSTFNGLVFLDQRLAADATIF